MKHKNSLRMLQIVVTGLTALLASHSLAGNLSTALKKERWYYTQKVHGSMKKGAASHRADLEMQKAMSEVSEDWKFREDMSRDPNSLKVEIAGVFKSSDNGKSGQIEMLTHTASGDLIKDIMTVPPGRVTPRRSHLNFHHDPDELIVVTRNNNGRLEERIPIEDEMFEMVIKEIDGKKYRATKSWEIKKIENGKSSHVVADLLPSSSGKGEDLLIQGRATDPKVAQLSLFKNNNQQTLHFTMEGDLVKVYTIKEGSPARVTEETFDLSKGTLLAEKQRKTRLLPEDEIVKMGLIVDSIAIRKTQSTQAGQAARGMTMGSAK